MNKKYNNDVLIWSYTYNEHVVSTCEINNKIPLIITLCQAVDSC